MWITVRREKRLLVKLIKLRIEDTRREADRRIARARERHREKDKTETQTYRQSDS